ncbi:MAG TPA: metallophosphoesterase, partial [Bacteroidales bacterium]|nr:metallophosphoesterase [Bacteroidales bacterium]
MKNKNPTTLIIPDLHHKWKQAEEIIKSVKSDQIIFLGDYFDDFNDTPGQVKNTCDWLKSSLSKPNRIHLFGNHDQHYAYSYSKFRCSGYEQWKYYIIRDNIDSKLWNKLKWFHFLDNQWLISHGGLHTLNLPDNIKKCWKKGRSEFIVKLTEYLNDEIYKGFQDIFNNKSSWVFSAGYSRGGIHRVGGITWCDFVREFKPFQGINQIVGHTPQSLPPHWCILKKPPSHRGGEIVYRPIETYNPSLADLNNMKLSH